jgi:hypothetical protein
MSRICIYPKDVAIITGKSERWGRNLIQKIKFRNHKAKHQLVTIEEFCFYTGLSISSVEKKLL